MKKLIKHILLVCTALFMNSLVLAQTSVVSVPNVFTPNGDGVNDQLIVNTASILEIKVEIFDRWGVKMAEWDQVLAGWDGRTMSGKEASAGAYYYTLKAKGSDNKEYDMNGFLTLLR